MKMSDVVFDVEEAVTREWMKSMADFGLNPTLMKIYSTLFFATDALGLAELSEKTGYSTSTICQNMDLLKRLTDIREFKRPGSKKIYYECQHNIKLIQKKKLETLAKQVENLVKVLKESEEKLATVDTDEANVKLGYIKELRTEYEKIISLMQKIDYIKGLTSIIAKDRK